MPRGDRTGPAGMGPRSGRGAGFCAGGGQPGAGSASARETFGRRRGLCNWLGSLGFPWWMQPGRTGDSSRSGDFADETDALRTQLDELKRRFDKLNGKE